MSANHILQNFHSADLFSGLSNVGGNTRSSEAKEDIIALQSKLKVKHKSVYFVLVH